MKKNIPNEDFINKLDSLYRLAWLFSGARDAVIKTRQKELRKIGITPAEASLLFITKILNGATYEDISVWAIRELHSVSSQVNRMEKNGLVTKVIESRKKNIKVLLTNKGEKALVLSLKGKVLKNIMSVLSKQEIETFYNCLYKIRKKSYEIMGIYRLPPWP